MQPMNRRAYLAFALVCVASFAACNRFDETRFDGIRRAGQALKSATGLGVTETKYRELVQACDVEASLATQKATIEEERTVAARYAEMCGVYRDALVVWDVLRSEEKRMGRAEPNACVEIHNPAALFLRLRATLGRWSATRAETLIHDEVSYWSPVNPPGNVYALPHRLTMNKHEDYREQCEYRFAFGDQRNVFDFQNVELSIRQEGMSEPRPSLDPAKHRLLIRVGPLADCCRLVD